MRQTKENKLTWTRIRIACIKINIHEKGTCSGTKTKLKVIVGALQFYNDIVTNGIISKSVRSAVLDWCTQNKCTLFKKKKTFM